MRKSGVAETADLGAYLQRMYPCEWEAEVDYFLSPKYLRSSVVYLFKCRCCSASYVSQTTRHLHTRISEHLGISPITGKHSTNPAISSILSHTNASGHPANFDDFQILSSSSDSYELMIHESLLINKYKPNLNVQGSSIPLNLF